MAQLANGNVFGPQHRKYVSTGAALALYRHHLTNTTIPVPVITQHVTVAQPGGSIPITAYGMLSNNAVQLMDPTIQLWTALPKTVSLAGYSPTAASLYEKLRTEAMRALNSLSNDAILQSQSAAMTEDGRALFLANVINTINQSTVTAFSRPATSVTANANIGFDSLNASIAARGLNANMATLEGFIAQGLIQTGRFNAGNETDALAHALTEAVCLQAWVAVENMARAKTSAWGDYLNKQTVTGLTNTVKDFSWQYLIDIAQTCTSIMRTFATHRDITTLLNVVSAHFAHSGDLHHTSTSAQRVGLLVNLVKRLRIIVQNTDVNKTVAMPMRDAIPLLTSAFNNYTRPIEHTIPSSAAPILMTSMNGALIGTDNHSGNHVTYDYSGLQRQHIIGGLQWVINELATAFGVAVPIDLQTAVERRLMHGQMTQSPRYAAATSYAGQLQNLVTPQANYLKDLFIENLVRCTYSTEQNGFSSTVIGLLDMSQKKDMNWLSLQENLTVFDTIIQALRDTVQQAVELATCNNTYNGDNVLWKLVCEDWVSLLNDIVTRDSSGSTQSLGLMRPKDWFGTDGVSNSLPFVQTIVEEHINQVSAFVLRQSNEREIVGFKDGVVGSDTVSVYYSTLDDQLAYEDFVTRMEESVNNNILLYPVLLTFGAQVLHVKAMPMTYGLGSKIDKVFVYNEILTVLNALQIPPIIINNILNHMGSVVNWHGAKQAVNMDATTASIFERSLAQIEQDSTLSIADRTAFQAAMNANQFFILSKDGLFTILDDSLQVMVDMTSGDRDSLVDWANLGNVVQMNTIFPAFAEMRRVSTIMRLNQTNVKGDAKPAKAERGALGQPKNSKPAKEKSKDESDDSQDASDESGEDKDNNNA